MLLLVVLEAAGEVTGVLQRFSWARFEQDVLLDLQGDLLDHTLRFPKSFFDDQEVGYLMSRLLSDVQRLRRSPASRSFAPANPGASVCGGFVL